MWLTPSGPAKAVQHCSCKVVAKQKKETRHRRNSCNAVRALKNCQLVNKPISKMGDGAPLMRPYGEVGARSSETRALQSGH